MIRTRVRIPYGKQYLDASLPEGWRVDMLTPAGAPPLEDLDGAVAHALDRPLGAEPIRRQAERAGRALVVVSDITRPVPNAAVMPALLERLDAAGVPPERVTVLVATGLHRPATAEEAEQILGAEAIRAGVTVVSHRAKQADEHESLGDTARGIPAAVDRRYLEAPLRVVIALVEPHFMAGFSGGPKSLCPGLAAADTILAVHAPVLLSHEKAAPGVIEGNPVREELWRVAEMAGPPELCVNFVLDIERRVAGVYGGGMAPVHEAAVAKARATLTASLGRPADIVLASGGGYPLDLTFYQGVKGMVAAASAVRPGGGIVVVQRNEEGVGSAEFAELLAQCRDPAAWEVDPTATRAHVVDEWQVLELALAARKAQIVNVCPDAPEQLRELVPLPTVDSIEEAFELLARDGVPGRATRRGGEPPHLAVMPDAPYTLVETGRR